MNVLKTFINCSLGQSFYRLIISKDENIKSKVCGSNVNKSNVNKSNVNGSNVNGINTNKFNVYEINTKMCKESKFNKIGFKGYKSEVYNTVDLYNKFDPYNKFNLYNKTDSYRLFKKDLWQWS